MTLNRLRQLFNYKGAGIAFMAPDEQGRTRVLLGQRILRPYAGFWALPGGGMDDQDNGSFRACAAREAFEETVGLPQLEGIQRQFEQRLRHAAERRTRLPPFFEFRTYQLALAAMPDLRLWPNIQSWNNEFRAFGWFSPEHLPRPMHPGLAKTLEYFQTKA